MSSSDERVTLTIEIRREVPLLLKDQLDCIYRDMHAGATAEQLVPKMAMACGIAMAVNMLLCEAMEKRDGAGHADD